MGLPESKSTTISSHAFGQDQCGPAELPGPPLPSAVARAQGVRRRPKWFILAFVLLAAALVAIVLREYWTVDELVRRELELRQAIEERPLAGFSAGFLIFTLLSFIPGLTGKALIVAWLFGFWRSLVIVNVGLTIAAVGEMLLARYFVRDYIQSRFGYYLVRLNDLLQREGASCVFALRMAHVPYTFTNYALGATRLSVPQFWWATQLGMLPGNAIFVYAGAQVPTLHEIVEHGVRDALQPGVMLAFVLLGVAPLVTKYFVKRVQRRSSSATA